MALNEWYHTEKDKITNESIINNLGVALTEKDGKITLVYLDMRVKKQIEALVRWVDEMKESKILKVTEDQGQ